VPDPIYLRFETSRGDFVVELRPEWAPLGVERVQALVAQNYFNDARFFRVLPGFVAQFGMAADPAVNAQWMNQNILDEPVLQSNVRGTLTFAKAPMPNTRSTQLFINLVDNPNLDAMGFSPIGRVIEGMNVVDSLYGGYGDLDQGQIATEGNAYLLRQHPLLDFIKTVTVVPAPAAPAAR
jgi:cyclophilin family peptidyl-prolyl cis-trans isomerase